MFISKSIEKANEHVVKSAMLHINNFLNFTVINNLEINIIVIHIYANYNVEFDE